MSHNIFWFRNNLRINDNYPLVQCIKDSTSISFVYIVNRHLRILDGDENHKNKFLIDALNQLKINLSKLGYELYIIEGEPSAIFSSLAKHHQINKIYLKILDLILCSLMIIIGILLAQIIKKKILNIS